MHPPITLKNTKHESFAQALAQGYPPTFAYAEAGFNSRNAAARAPHLAKNPQIRARVKALKDALPRIQDLQARFAPSALLMPDTKEQMSAILWQIGSGLRPILPVQLRALTLFCRIKGWHLTPRNAAKPRTRPIPGMPWPKEEEEPAAATSAPVHLTLEEQTLLTTLAQQIIAADQAHTPFSPGLTQAFLAAMTDATLPANDPSDQTDQTDQTAPQSQTASPPSSPPNPQNLHIFSTSQTPDSQPLTPKIPEPAPISATARSTPSVSSVPSVLSASSTKASSKSEARTAKHSPTPPRNRPPHDHWSPAFARSLRSH